MANLGARNIICGTMLSYQIGLAFSGIVMLTGICPLIGAASRSQVASLIISALFFLAPLFLSISKQDPFFRIIGLLPVYHIQFSSLMSIGHKSMSIGHRLLSIGHKLLSIEQIKGNLLYAAWAFPCAGVVAASGAILSRVFATHQVTA